MNGLVQQAKRAARGFGTAPNFIAMTYLRLRRTFSDAFVNELREVPNQAVG